MQKLLLTFGALCLISFAGPAAVQAQTTAPATTTENSAQAADDGDDGFDMGWLGLLGLIGLAGLRGRSHRHDHTTTVPR